MLKVKNIHASYGHARVLNDVSLDVHEGEIVALVGANGAGKTSLVNVICGLLKPSSGELSFLESDLTSKRPHLRAELGISVVPEGRKLFPKLTVEENLLVGGINKRSRNHRQENMKAVFEMFPRLEERRKQVARTLSGGEQQMLAIGRALMGEPKLIIFDEPSLGLAPKIVLEVFEIIRKLNTENQLTVLLIEQNVAVSLNIATRAYVLENGKMVLSGPGKELLGNEHVKQAYLGI